MLNRRSIIKQYLIVNLKHLFSIDKCPLMRRQSATHPPAHVPISIPTLAAQSCIPSFDGFPYPFQLGALHIRLTELPGIVTPKAVISRVFIFLPTGCTFAIRLPAFNVLDVHRSREFTRQQPRDFVPFGVFAPASISWPEVIEDAAHLR